MAVLIPIFYVSCDVSILCTLCKAQTRIYVSIFLNIYHSFMMKTLKILLFEIRHCSPETATMQHPTTTWQPHVYYRVPDTDALLLSALIPPLLSQSKYPCAFNCREMDFLRLQLCELHRVPTFLCLAYSDLQFHSCHKWQFHSFYSWMVFHCAYVTHFIHLSADVHLKCPTSRLLWIVLK